VQHAPDHINPVVTPSIPFLHQQLLDPEAISRDGSYRSCSMNYGLTLPLPQHHNLCRDFQLLLSAAPADAACLQAPGDDPGAEVQGLCSS
jgi:hypothetical protein